MKKYLKITAAIITIITTLTACSIFTGPPSKTEQHFFDVNTNYAALVQDGKTNLVPVYHFTPNTNAISISKTAGEIGGLFGVGGITSTAASALFGVWAMLRSRRSLATANTLAQIIETGREVMKTLPDGQKYDDVYVQWMKAHQGEAGVISQVAAIVSNVVDNQTAKEAAQEIQNLISAQMPK